MPAKLDKNTKRIALIATEPWLKKIEAWRSQQPGLPNTSEAIRRLVEMSLDAEKAEKKGGKGGR